MAEIKELSDKHTLFVYEYINNNFNATRAYMAVYEVDENTAAVNGCKLLTNANIRQAIDKAIDESIMADKKELAKRVIAEYKKIAFSDVKNYIDPATGQAIITDETDTSALESVQFDTVTRDRETTLEKTKYKLYNKINALDSLSKFILGFAEKHEVEHSGNMEIIYLDRQDEKL
jgi:phage terminase small subunit